MSTMLSSKPCLTSMPALPFMPDRRIQSACHVCGSILYGLCLTVGSNAARERYAVFMKARHRGGPVGLHAAVQE